MLPQSNNIFQIQQKYLELMRLIEEAEGEITPEIDNALQLTEQQLQEAAINIGFVIKALDANIQIIDAEMVRLGLLYHKAEKGKELLKNRLSQSMQQFGIEKIESPTMKISFRKSESVEITDEALLPAAYFVPKPPEPNKRLIKEEIKSGKDIPGATLREKKNLQIK